jgi:hypothetical protein
MDRLDILLLHALHFDESHVGATHGFADRLSVIRSVFVTFYVGRHELWGDQFHLESVFG